MAKRIENQNAYSLLNLQVLLSLPGLTGLWFPGNTERSTGDIYDLSGHGHTLSYNGDPALNLHDNVVPYYAFDGTGDYFSRADEANLDIRGNESHVDSGIQGLTCGAWVWLDTSGANQSILTKGRGGNSDSAYFLRAGPTPKAIFFIGDGSSFHVATSATTLFTDTWYFLVGRFEPSTEVSVFVNGSEDGSDTTGIPATLLDVSHPLNLGANDSLTPPGDPFHGRIGPSFLLHTALPDALIEDLFEQTRSAFGV